MNTHKVFVLICLVFAFTSLIPYTASATAGDITVTVQSELGYPLSGAGVSIMCSGGSTVSVGQSNGSGTLTVATSSLQSGGSPDYSAAQCGGSYGKNITIIATSTGFIASSTAGVTATTNNFTLNGIKYAFKVVSMLAEDGTTNVMPTAGLPFSASGNLSLASSTYNLGNTSWYLAASSTLSGGTLTATSSGYIDRSISSVTSPLLSATTSPQKTISFGGSGHDFDGSAFPFGLKVIVDDQLGTAVIPQSATYRGNATTSSSGSTLYWADTSGTAGVLNIIAPGYLYATSTNSGFQSVKTDSTRATQVAITLGNNSATTTPITISGTAKGLQPTLLIPAGDLLDELGNNIAPTSGLPFSVSGALALISQTYNNGAWYVAASSTNTSGGTLTAAVNGYVTQSVSTILTSTTTQYSVTFGGSGSTYYGVGLPFGLKVNVQNQGLNISGATVTAGDSSGVTCIAGSIGLYYCAIPLVQTGTVATASKTGYTVATGSYTDRSLGTDPQSTVGINLGSPSSGGSGGGFANPVTYPISIPISKPAPTGSSTLPVGAGGAGVGGTGISTLFTSHLSYGMSSPDVTRLQTLLASDPSVYPEGLVTGYFGSLTQAAVGRFQEKYGIVKPGSQSEGEVGPLTRAMLQKVFGSQ